MNAPIGSRRTSRPPAHAVSPQFRMVAIPAGIALGAIGAIAAERLGLPAIVGFVGGALAAGLTVLALPSVPTRRATVLLLGVGGLGALRHAPYPGRDRVVLLTAWAVATLVALVMIDRVDAEKTSALSGGRPFAALGGEVLRVSAVLGAIVIAAAVALVPVVTDRLGRRVWPGLEPSSSDVLDSPTSLRATEELDMTTRPRLSDKVVFTVDSPRADFWRGETFDTWSGRAWTRSIRDEDLAERDQANRVLIDPAADDAGAASGEQLRQTFHIESGFSDIVFAAPSPRVVETDKVVHERPDGTASVGGGASSGFGKGAVYTVVSQRFPSTAADLRAADRAPVPATVAALYAQPVAATTERVRTLAAEITAGSPTTYEKVRAIEAWLGQHTKYSLNAPLSPAGVDVVDDFLFRSKLGWCEQIASSLVVLAREVGIPARLVTGFVPGERDALTGRFVVRERDAHAWAEIFFPGIGWQGFDPTASVPLAGEAKAGGSALSNLRRHTLPIALGAVLIVLIIVATPELRALARRRRARRSSWAARRSSNSTASDARRGAGAHRPRHHANTRTRSRSTCGCPSSTPSARRSTKNRSPRPAPIRTHEQPLTRC